MEMLNGFFLGVAAMFLLFESIKAEANELKVFFGFLVIVVSGFAVFLALSTPKVGDPVKNPSPGEYPVLSVVTRQADENAYLLVEDDKEVRFIVVPRAAAEKAVPSSVLKVEPEKLLPKKFVFK